MDTFITSLYSLSEHCDYGALREEMIRDRIVVGIRDAALLLKLQLMETLPQNCSKHGHFKAMCKSHKKIGEVYEEPDTTEYDSDECFLGAVGTGGNNRWQVTLHLNDNPTEFQIDTGAEASIISEGTHQKIGSPSLSQVMQTFKGPDQRILPILGRFTGRLRKDDVEVEQEIFVAKEVHKPLLGQPAIEALGLVQRIRGIRTKQLNPVEQFPSLFQGLGKLQGQYSIKLQEGAKPYALTTPRRVPIPLMKPVKEELERMEKMGVISRISEPTDWCAGMVVVPKANGKVRICVDLTHLNNSVCRERHPLPAVEQTMAQLAGAKIFSKLDANSGFWQIPLTQESIPLTTFIIPFGRFCFHRLPFGITSAPEHFQRRMQEIVGDIEGVVCLIDDILIHGCAQEEHDERLLRVLCRLQKEGLTLNRDKCQFSQRQVPFLDQVVDESGIQPDPEK